MALERAQRGRNGKTHTRTYCTDLGGESSKTNKAGRKSRASYTKRQEQNATMKTAAPSTKRREQTRAHQAQHAKQEQPPQPAHRAAHPQQQHPLWRACKPTVAAAAAPAARLAAPPTSSHHLPASSCRNLCSVHSSPPTTREPKGHKGGTKEQKTGDTRCALKQNG